MKCVSFAFVNGEFADTCANCAATLPSEDVTVASSSARVLKPQGSHPEAPDKKKNKNEDNFEEQLEDDDAKTMLKKMMGIFGGYQTEMKDLKQEVKETREKVNQSVSNASLALATSQKVAVDVDEMKETMKSCNAVMKKDSEHLKTTVITKGQVEEVVRASVASAVDLKFQGTRTDHAKLKVGSAAMRGQHDHNDTAVFKGFTGESMQSAEEWITKKITELQLPTPEVIYMKGEEFKGLMFARFEYTDDMTKVVNEMAKSTHMLGEHAIRCNPERPIEKRAPISLMLGLRWQLNQWGTYEKSQIKVDDNTMVMKIDRTPVLVVSTLKGRVNLEWLDEEWKNWRELHESPEFKKLIDAANENLAKSSVAIPEKKGKGPASVGQSH